MTKQAIATATIEDDQTTAKTIADLKAAFDRLPDRQRRHFRYPPTGDAAIDTLVFVTPGRSCEDFEGVIVNGTRLPDGRWDFDCDFTLFTTEHEWVRFVGSGCEVTIL